MKTLALSILMAALSGTARASEGDVDALRPYVDDHFRVFHILQRPSFESANEVLARHGLETVTGVSGWTLEFFRNEDWIHFGGADGTGKNVMNIGTKWNFRKTPWVTEEGDGAEVESASVLFTWQAARNINPFLRLGYAFGMGPGWLRFREKRGGASVDFGPHAPGLTWVPAVAVNLRHGRVPPFLLLEVGYEWNRVGSPAAVSGEVSATEAPNVIDLSGPYLALGLGF